MSLQTTAPGPPAPPPLDVRFEWNRDEFARSFDATTRHSRQIPPRWMGWVILGFVCASTARTYVHSAGDAIRFGSITGAVLFVCWLIPYLAGRQYARIKEREIGPDGRLIVTAFSGEGIYRSNGRTEASFAWGSIRRAVETDEFLLLYYRRGNAFFIPRRAIPPKSLGEVRALIRRHLAGRAKLHGD
ncbi:YcxB family protein [Longimicrobium terrae]|uniref:YcxB-like C-terminal domain-containing protein n=1 Tax=Longimicrobium terrae TaxID=1639882 RepID=A0A841H3K0_9BACT|nr:YcxB family protein [Longimicrobium terrae]MBB4638352.1 hypothetical protein [Longimicrobium terrae]MBB6072580.1 hypothetical protein [Longimicrobium terrae]NNC28641.1 YcxB family protein [Longimicrobium terrae]